MGRALYSEEEILGQLDDCAEAFEFPQLDLLNTSLGDVRLSAYRDDRRWAILIEVLSYTSGAEFPSCDIYHYGNCLRGAAGLDYKDSISVLEYEVGERGTVPPTVTTARIRGREVPIPRDRKSLKARGIKPYWWPDLSDDEVMRALLPEHRDALLATEKELRRRIPAKLPFFLRLDAWHHPDVFGEERPSENSTFQALAEALVLGDPNRFRLTEPPNTHWKNWEDSGD